MYHNKHTQKSSSSLSGVKCGLFKACFTYMLQEVYIRPFLLHKHQFNVMLVKYVIMYK